MKRPAISAAALLVLLALIPAAGPAATTHTYRGTIHELDPRAGMLSLTCGVGMALRVVHIRISPAALGSVHGEGPAPAPWKRGDIVRVDCHESAEGLVADHLSRVVTQ